MSVSNLIIAIAYNFGGYGWQYIDSGSGSDWIERGMANRATLTEIRELTGAK